MQTTKLETSEIQGLLVSGYAKQPFACHILLSVVDPVAAGGWLRQVLGDVSFCGNKDSASKLNIAFSHTALQALGCSSQELGGFSREYCEGIVTAHRQRILGDLDGSPGDPGRWAWGGPRNGPVHILLMAYESTPALLEARLREIRRQLAGVQLVRELPTTPLRENREHFGFHDGIAQPAIRGLGRPGGPANSVAAGEFVLGYDDETGAPEPAPEFARNGSYLVLRQVVQDVPGFWGAFRGLPDPVQKIALAARMMGRWPDGTPLALSPDFPLRANPTNDFTYAQADPGAMRCPFGSHIRRSNPRDTLLDDAAKSLEVVNHHRILRRGRTFGLPAPRSAFPEGLHTEAAEGATGSPDLRGIHFLCLNASLSRQFEFVQQTWLNNPKFGNLTSDTDPVASPVTWSAPGENPAFTIQGCPENRRVPRPAAYVSTMGGGYFFLPGRTALQRLCRG